MSAFDTPPSGRPKQAKPKTAWLKIDVAKLDQHAVDQIQHELKAIGLKLKEEFSDTSFEVDAR